ncbi:unnamed protein product [Rhizophagus irregularis]|nr:unnamed protein product [Rhizophagus irregularis]
MNNQYNELKAQRDKLTDQRKWKSNERALASSMDKKTNNDPNKWTAVEVTAGQSLFHVVVDTDDTATKVLDVLNREQSGRVTFMPLNRLRTKTLEYPES